VSVCLLVICVYLSAWHVVHRTQADSSIIGAGVSAVLSCTVARTLSDAVLLCRPSFFAHVSALLSKAPESPVAYFISTPPAASVAASASRSSRDKASPVTSTTPRGLALRAAGVSKAHAVLGSNDLSDSCCGARSKHTRAHIGGQRGAGGAGNRRVGELRGKKMHADGTIWYLAHWEEGDTDDDTWEQAAGLGSDEWLVSEWEAEQTALRKPAISVRA